MESSFYIRSILITLVINDFTQVAIHRAANEIVKIRIGRDAFVQEVMLYLQEEKILLIQGEQFLTYEPFQNVSQTQEDTIYVVLVGVNRGEDFKNDSSFDDPVVEAVYKKELGEF